MIITDFNQVSYGKKSLKTFKNIFFESNFADWEYYPMVGFLTLLQYGLFIQKVIVFQLFFLQQALLHYVRRIYKI